MTTYVNASCQCELNAFRVAFDTASLPIPSDLCHCSSCRHSSGQMALCYTTIKDVPLQRTNGLSVHSSRSPSRSSSQLEEGIDSQENGTHHGNVVPAATANGSLAPPSISVQEAETPYELSDLRTYNATPNVTRYFCKSCSAQIFFVQHKTGGDVWSVASGALERVSGIFKIKFHMWVGDTVDGGLADQLRVIDGLKLPRYKEGKYTEEVPFPRKGEGYAPSAVANETKSKDNILEAYCHCKTISFKITRPSEASFVPTAAYPDLILPYGMSRLSKINNPKDEKWWLRPASSSNPTKYLAGHCMCNFCRLASGFDIQSWAFIPLANIMRSDMSAPLCLEIDAERPTGLQQYISSPGEYIEFCGTCGATVFSWQAGMPDLVNVSVGLLDETKEGARAEGWFEWHRERVSFQEKALNSSIATGLAEGLKTEY